MALDTGRPRQRNQTSRRGKKAWRKNIDLDEFEQNVDEQRDAEIVLGPNEQLFTVDKQGSEEGLTNRMKKERRLKSLEILQPQSAVPAIIPRHKKADKPKHKVMKNRRELLERAGFTEKSSRLANVERDGVLRNENTTDLWGSSESASKSTPYVPENRAKKVPAVRPAKSLVPEAPLPGTVAVELPMAGQSYNPALEDWKQAILAEHAKIEKAEERQAQLDEQQSRIDAIIAETEARLADPVESESEEDEEINPEEIGKLSVNPPTKVKRKTRTQRNRQQRHKLRLFELATLRQKKEFMKKLAAEAEAKRNGANQNPELKVEKPKKKLARAHSKYPVMEEPLALKLSDELDDSLRRLKPEGDLLKERLRSLQARGIIDARVKVKKPKSRSKMVEKYSFKHFE